MDENRVFNLLEIEFRAARRSNKGEAIQACMAAGQAG